MSKDEKELKRLSKDLDVEKLSGRYIHFGHFFEDFQRDGGIACAAFYEELFKFHKSVLADFFDKPEFLQVKDLMEQSLEFVQKKFKDLTKETMETTYKRAVEYTKENPEELTKYKKDKDKNLYI